MVLLVESSSGEEDNANIAMRVLFVEWTAKKEGIRKDPFAFGRRRSSNCYRSCDGVALAVSEGTRWQVRRPRDWLSPRLPCRPLPSPQSTLLYCQSDTQQPFASLVPHCTLDNRSASQSRDLARHHEQTLHCGPWRRCRDGASLGAVRRPRRAGETISNNQADHL